MRQLIEELAWATDKRLWVISNIMLFITVIPLRNQKIKLFQVYIYCMCCYIPLSKIYFNCFIIYYWLMLHGSTIMFSST